MFKALPPWLLILFFAIAATGCAVPPSKPDPESMQGIKRLGVVSLLGEEIEAKYAGFTVFGNEYFRTAILEWRLNQKIIEQVTGVLTKNGFEVIPLDYRYQMMWEKYQKSQESYKTRVNAAYGNDTTTPLLKQDLEQLAKLHSVDGFVLVVPGHQGSYCPGGEVCSGYGNYGFGIHNRLNKVFDGYVSARIFIVPLKTLTSAAQVHANSHVSLPFKEWRETFSEYTKEEQEAIRAILYSAAETAIPTAIQSMDLLPE